jgi:urease beta subunit
MKPGQIIPAASEIILNEGKQSHLIVVTNTGDRPVQIGSHFHFFEVNKALTFDRPQTLGMRLNIKAGTAVRFEPGQTSEVSLIPYGGSGYISGFNRLVEGSIHDPKVREKALEAVKNFCKMPSNE